MDLFNVDVYGNIRRVQGLIRSASKEIHAVGREVASPRILAAIAEMRRVGRVRVPYFCDLLARLKSQASLPIPRATSFINPVIPCCGMPPLPPPIPFHPTKSLYCECPR